MATLILQSAGTAIGSALGGPLGAVIGAGVGAVGGSLLSGALGGGSQRAGRRVVEGPRLRDLDGITASEGAPIPRVYGRARMGGQIIWATRFEEEVITSPGGEGGQRGGKSVVRQLAGAVAGGSGASSAAPAAGSVTYRYYANIAVGLCEGPIAMVRRVWADGRLLDLVGLTMRVHRGAASQPADPLIVAKQGSADVPSYNGLAYVVFERLPLDMFGNRLPQLTFEVVRPVSQLASMVRAVDLIPGASEFAYHPAHIMQVLGEGVSRSENRHQTTHESDWQASLDALQALCPATRNVALVCSWFGDDLRAGVCTVRPKVEHQAKTTLGANWSVGPLQRASAELVSRVEGRPAYGGTPSDDAVVRAIRDLKGRGLAVTLYPFLMMDVPAGNERQNPWTGAATQPPYPWRGRITCDPAPGRPGTADSTAAAAAQIAALFGTASATDFSVSGDTVIYTGPDEWSLRRLVLHYAALTQIAGGVDAFVMLSELAALTRVRSATGVYPAVAQLKALAAQVRVLIGPACKLVYAADWTEYASHVPQPGELRFPLDPLWADVNIDAVGIDWYPPLSDWRNGLGHADASDADGPQDAEHLRQRVASGEAYDWYYPDASARARQERTPITDGAAGKPWVYRIKDLKSWWANAHVERLNDTESATPTAWVPRSKPLWLTEIGCPAVDRGANGPNVFPDPKSSESLVPPFSRGTRDDLVQARTLAATIRRFDPRLAGFNPDDNPEAALPGGRMVDPDRIYVWAWDARPFPAFPVHGEIWADGANWREGHWITGRIEGAPLDDVLRQIWSDYGIAAPLAIRCDGFVDGYVIDRPMSVRSAFEGLLAVHGAEMAVDAAQLRILQAGHRASHMIDAASLVPDKDGRSLRLSRVQDSELPRSIAVSFVDAAGEYRRAAVTVTRTAAGSRRDLQISLAAVLQRAEVQRCAERLLYDAWQARETVEFRLPPSQQQVQVGDCVSLLIDGAERRYQVTRIEDGPSRAVSARRLESGHTDAVPTTPPPANQAAPAMVGPAHVLVVDLPQALSDAPVLQHLAITAEPWTGGYVLWRADGGSYGVAAGITARSMVGSTLTILPPGPLWRWDNGSALEVRFPHGTLTSREDEAVLAGANLMAVRGADLAWEVIGFRTATLLGPGRWRISGLLRGLGGSEAAAARTLPAGAAVVVLDHTLTALEAGAGAIGRTSSYRLSPSGKDHADPMAVSFTATPGGAAYRPLAPVHLRARRTPQGISLTWIRRTRLDGDAWDIVEVPLGETVEQYEIDIRKAGAVVRTATVAQPAYTYATADELEDFGAAQTELQISLCQWSSVVGRGWPTLLTVPVD